MAASLLSL